MLFISICWIRLCLTMANSKFFKTFFCLWKFSIFYKNMGFWNWGYWKDTHSMLRKNSAYKSHNSRTFRWRVDTNTDMNPPFIFTEIFFKLLCTYNCYFITIIEYHKYSCTTLYLWYLIEGIIFITYSCVWCREDMSAHIKIS